MTLNSESYMSNEPAISKNVRKKLLIITSSGGGGLIQTANAKEQEALVKDPNLLIVRRDIFRHWVWKPFGNFCVNFWNKAQLGGNLKAQKICVWGQFLVDYFLYPTLFIHALYTLFKEDVDQVIDTQPMGTVAILQAIRIYNARRGKNVRLEKILVDLPTKKATHFFRPIKGLSKKNRRNLQLTSIVPLLEKGETAEEFWQTNCGMSEKEVHYEEVYVRQAFQKFKRKIRSDEIMKIKVKFKNREERDLMRKTIERGSISANLRESEFEFKIRPEDRMVTVLLGSQPAKEGTLNYTKKFAALVKEFPKTPFHLFVFCADHQEGEDSLFRKVTDFACQIKDFPKHFSIIPFSFQNEDVIAPLLYRSDATCTRSGGQTAMELMCVSTGEMWIHSEAKEKNPSMEMLLEGIPGWEAESAIYLQRMRGAKVVTPETFIPHARRLFQSNGAQALASRQLESTA